MSVVFSHNNPNGLQRGSWISANMKRLLSYIVKWEQ